MGIYSISNYSNQLSQVLSIYFIYIPSPIIEAEVLYTLPYNTFTTKVTVEVKQRQQQYATEGSTSGPSISTNRNDFRTIKHIK